MPAALLGGCPLVLASSASRGLHGNLGFMFSALFDGPAVSLCREFDFAHIVQPYPAAFRNLGVRHHGPLTIPRTVDSGTEFPQPEIERDPLLSNILA